MGRLCFQRMTLFSVKIYSTGQDSLNTLTKSLTYVFAAKLTIGGENSLSLVYFSKLSMNMVNDGKGCYSTDILAQVGRGVQRRYGKMN